uniref:J domain-containing protein n=1 Tax=Bionectria ochroleuca TaxID=29856 RepID=A0A8H7TPI7_BIOOC
MKVSFVSIGLLAMLSPLVAAWSTEDREIFRIRDELINNEPDSPGTFYDILGISPHASQDDITKAYRQKTKTLHPDKAELAAAVKRAGERQARLSLIVNILKGPERDRYDHFLNNGFPLWKGTDYYYDRYRPGLGTAIFGVFLVGGGAIHYLILYMSWKRQKEFVGRYVKYARETAWGKGFVIPVLEPTPVPDVEEDDEEDGPPQPMNRKQRRLQERESKKEDARVTGKKARKAKSASVSRDPSTAPTAARKRVVAENGKILVVDSVGNVYLEEEDEDGVVNEFLLDPEELAQPTVFDTAVVRVPAWAFNTTIGRFLPKPAAKQEVEFDIDDDSDDAQHTPERTLLARTLSFSRRAPTLSARQRQPVPSKQARPTRERERRSKCSVYAGAQGRFQPGSVYVDHF